MKSRLLIVLGLLVFGWLFFTFTWNALLQTNQTPVNAEKSGLSSDQVDSIVANLFTEYDLQSPPTGISTLLDKDGVLMDSLLKDLQSSMVEVYLLKGEGTKQLRIYDRTSLRYVVEVATKQPPFSEITNPEGVITVALLITGLENKKIDPLLNLDVPVNLVLSPDSPFALYNAVTGAKKWNEIILDVSNSDFFSLDSLPMVSGIWTKNDDIPLPYGVVSVGPNNSVSLDISNSNPFNGQHRIYTTDARNTDLESLQEWIGLLPENIQLVRLSHWSIVPN